MWTRRGFLAVAGAGFVQALMPRAAEALDKADLVFATAGKNREGDFIAGLVSDRGETISQIKLPARGHDITQCPETQKLVVFARRPGAFAIVFDRSGNVLNTITSVDGRHFFGHGTFSADGRLLYTTENDFEAARGVIGIYDATAEFARIGEFTSGGIGPHDLALNADGSLLCVANGGIETHPDFGRTKLNLATMQPNLTWIERETGSVVATHNLPPDLHQLSLRHLAFGVENKIWVGGQYQGQAETIVPLLASASPDEELTFAPIPENQTTRLSAYVGSVATSADGKVVVATSPVGDVALRLDLAEGTSSLIEATNVSGVAHTKSGFALSTGNGALLGPVNTIADVGFAFDNHLVSVVS